jgi:ADP-ribosyl-[dinitrogen reductase] hydrolase
MQSAVTHRHARSKVSCALYCLWVRRILEADSDAWNNAVRVLRGLIEGDIDAQEALEMHIVPDQAATGRGSGYVIDTLRTVRMIWETPGCAADPERALRAAIALGHDTDTTACVLGGLLGAAGGLAAFPGRWRDAMKGRDLVEPLLAGLLDR